MFVLRKRLCSAEKGPLADNARGHTHTEDVCLSSARAAVQRVVGLEEEQGHRVVGDSVLCNVISLITSSVFEAVTMVGGGSLLFG